MTEEINNNQNLYQCKECGLNYRNKEFANKCEAWCKEYKTCNVEITAQAEENKLNALEKRCDEYLNNWKRERADFLNYKKDEMERIGFLGKYVKEDIIFKILPILDNIYLAEKQLPENLKSGKGGSAQAIEWTKGFLQIQNQITEFLKKEGIEEIKTTGQKFNPNFHEVVEEIGPSEALAKEASVGTIVEELQKGYKINDKVLRPAKVKISK